MNKGAAATMRRLSSSSSSPRRRLESSLARWRHRRPLSTLPLCADYAVGGEEVERGGGREATAPPTTTAAAEAAPAPPPKTRPRPIYVAATKQHVGKTTTSLALLSGLMKRFPRVGFLKPVGQQSLPVADPATGETMRIDKDAVLVREHFGLDHLDYRSMSPVLIGSGYTRDYVDGAIRIDEQMRKIAGGFAAVRDASDVVLCEGTGHCAVGSIVGASNARVAGMIGADMVLVANGGLGSTFDELELNRVLCEAHGVNVAGVIVNKVRPDKYESTRDYLSRALMQTWGVPLLGCVPDRPFLGCPALADLERLFDTELTSGRRHRFRHYRVSDINLVTTSLHRFLENVRAKPRRTLYVTHATRDDIVLGFLTERSRLRRHGTPFEAALLVCGRKEKYDVSPQIMDMLRDKNLGDDVPVMIARMSTHDAMERMISMTPKLNVTDTHRVETAVAHYEPYIDFDLLLSRTTLSSPSAAAEEEVGDVAAILS